MVFLEEMGFTNAKQLLKEQILVHLEDLAEQRRLHIERFP
jgi:hypothetical protein